MGQSLDSMTQNQSREELLYQLINSGNVEAIKALCREGVNLEWIDKEGKTPLIVACLDSGLVNVARTLIDMGANVNAYRPGRHAGTPLHHAAKRGLEQTVLLLLSSGANALVRNDDCHTALDIARIKGHVNVVRAIENQICFFSGWLREFHGPGFLEALAPQLLSREIWVVVIPCGSNNPLKPLKLELIVYSSLQDAQPHTVVALWKAMVEEPKFHQSDPRLTVFDSSTKTRYRFASFNEGNKQQLRMLYDACRGIPQVRHPPTHHNSGVASPVTSQQTSTEALDLAMALSASIQSAAEERPPLNAHQIPETINPNGWGNASQNESHHGWAITAISANSESDSVQSAAEERPLLNAHQNPETINPNGWGNASQNESPHGSVITAISANSKASSSGWMDKEETGDYNGWGVSSSGSISNQSHTKTHENTSLAVQTSGLDTTSVSLAPSAPPIPDEAFDEGPIRYPTIDFSPGDSVLPPEECGPSVKSNAKDGDSSSLCIICWEAPIEGACIPCGHMAGCMACLSEIKAKKGVCPVCRAQINQIIRLYAV